MTREQDQTEISKAVDGFTDALYEQLTLVSKLPPALLELRDLITSKYPDAQFKVTFRLDDPFGVQLRPIIDLEDETEIMDVYADKLLDIQIEQKLPIHVFPERPRKGSKT